MPGQPIDKELANIPKLRGFIKTNADQVSQTESPAPDFKKIVESLLRRIDEQLGALESVRIRGGKNTAGWYRY
jgi:hypothetical protein